jgi:hypothetical protein
MYFTPPNPHPKPHKNYWFKLCSKDNDNLITSSVMTPLIITSDEMLDERCD